MRVPSFYRARSVLVAASFVLPSACLTAPAETTADGDDEVEADDDDARTARIAAAASLLTGRFDSSAQAAADTRYFAVQLRACAIDLPALGEHVLYVEQAMLESADEPYRQRVYVLTADGDTVVSAVSELVDPARFVGLCDLDDADRAASAPVADDALLLPGCSVLLTATDDGFSGSTDGASCLNDFRGATYATSEVTLTANEIRSWDRGYDANDVQVWGAVAGPYQFVRQP